MKRLKTLIVLCFCGMMLSAQVQLTQRDTELKDLEKAGWKIQSTSLSFDKNTVVFAAKKPHESNYNLFVAKKKGSKWDTPEALSDINTSKDELWPSLSSDETQIYFVRRHPADKSQKTDEQWFIYLSTFTDGKWDKGQKLIISNGTDIAPVILPDNQTLIFASKRPIEDKKEQTYSLYFTRKMGKYNWLVPELMLTAKDKEKGVNYYGVVVGGDEKEPTLRFTKQTCSRKDTAYSTQFLPLAKKYRPLPILTLTGSVRDAANNADMANTITVYNAITSQPITHLTNDGHFAVALPTGNKYLLDVTAPNYSHIYMEYDCQNLANDSIETRNLMLSGQLSIHVNVFDAEMQTPLDIVHCSPLNIAKATEDGVDITLPIGDVHTIEFSRKGFTPETLTIDTRKEVLLYTSELDLDLHPGKAPLEIALFDIDTHERIRGKIQIDNLKRNEQLIYNEKTEVRQGDEYALTISVPKYLFCDTVISIPYSDARQTYSFGLREIRRDLVMQLKNIQFEYNSASLLESSYTELDKVLRLLRENPGLTIELSAHTDDIGKDAYNDKLSNRRGESAKEYLVKQGISPDRIKAIGYGKRKPLVPNDSDEHRAMNRRVEFKVLGI